MGVVRAFGPLAKTKNHVSLDLLAPFTNDTGIILQNESALDRNIYIESQDIERPEIYTDEILYG